MEIDFAKIKELNKEIQKLLEERPEMQEWWNEMQEEMRKAGPNNKFAVAQDLMLTKFRELNEELQKLRRETKRWKK